MTNPFAAIKEEGQIQNPFSVIDENLQEPEKPRGFFETLNNLARHTGGFNPSSLMLGTFGSAVTERKRIMGEPTTADLLGRRAAKLPNIIKDVFGIMTRDPETMVRLGPQFQAKFKETMEGLGASVSSVEGLGQFAKSILLTPITDALEGSMGVTLTDPEMRELSPEERADRITATVANGLAAVTGTKAAQIVSRTRKITSAAANVPTLTLDRIGSAAFGGVIGGAAYGFVEGAKNDDQAASMFAFGLIGAPLGVAFGVAHGVITKGARVKVTQQADAMARLRQVRIATDATVEEALSNFTFLTETGDPGLAAVLTQATRNPEGATVVQGVEGIVVVKEAALGGSVVAHKRADGLHDVLVIGKDSPLHSSPAALKMFETFGVMPDELVSWGGRDYSVNGVSVKGVTLKDIASSELVPDVPPGNLTRNSKVEVAGARASAYADFKSWLGETIGPDLATVDPSSLLPFESYVRAYGAARGIPEASLQSMSKFLGIEMTRDLIAASMDPKEFRFLQKLERDAVGTRTRAAEELANVADANGYTIHHQEGGRFTLRDRSKTKVLTFSDVESAKTFIRSSGQDKTVDLLDRNSTFIDGGAGGTTLPPGGAGQFTPGHVPRTIIPRGKLGQFFDFFDAHIAMRATPRAPLFKALDNIYKTNMHAEVYDRLQVARRTSDAAMHPWMKELKQLDDLATGMNSAERELITGWLETASPDELMGTMSPEAIRISRRLVADEADIAKVFDFRRQRSELSERYSGNHELFLAKIDELSTELGMSPNDLTAAAIFDEVVRLPRDVMSLGQITRLARALTPDNTGRLAMSRGEYTKFHKLTPRQIELGTAIDAIYRRLGDTFGIGPEARIYNYAPHYRLYDKGSSLINSIHLQGGNVKAREFLSALARTGEIDMFERDPITQLVRYVKGGFDAQHFEGAVAEAKTAFAKMLETVPAGSKAQVNDIVQTYVNDLRHVPGMNDTFMQEGFDMMIKETGVPLRANLRRDFIRSALILGESGAQGARVIAGMRDINTNMSATYGRFGALRLGSVMRKGIRGVSKGTQAELKSMGINVEPNRHALAEAGEIPGLSILQFESPAEAALRQQGLGKVSKGIERVGEIGLKLSGQQYVYSVFHAGHYLDTVVRTGRSLSRMVAGTLSPDDVARRLDLDSYSPPTQQQFWKLVDERNYEGAAKFLGRTTAQEMVNIYGNANNPQGWSTNWGRLLGQFGSWSMWNRTFYQQMLSQGTLGKRAVRLGRVTAYNAAMATVAGATGLNLAKFYTAPAAHLLDEDAPWVPGLGFVAPVVQTAQTIFSAAGESGRRQRDAMTELLKIFPYVPEEVTAALGANKSATGFHIPHLWAPGSLALNDFIEAYLMSEKRAPGEFVAARAIGIRPRDPKSGGLVAGAVSY